MLPDSGRRLFQSDAMQHMLMPFVERTVHFLADTCKLLQDCIVEFLLFKFAKAPRHALWRTPEIYRTRKFRVHLQPEERKNLLSVLNARRSAYNSCVALYNGGFQPTYQNVKLTYDYGEPITEPMLKRVKTNDGKDDDSKSDDNDGDVNYHYDDSTGVYTTKVKAWYNAAAAADTNAIFSQVPVRDVNMSNTDVNPTIAAADNTCDDITAHFSDDTTAHFSEVPDDGSAAADSKCYDTTAHFSKVPVRDVKMRNTDVNPTIAAADSNCDHTTAHFSEVPDDGSAAADSKCYDTTAHFSQVPVCDVNMRNTDISPTTAAADSNCDHITAHFSDDTTAHFSKVPVRDVNPTIAAADNTCDHITAIFREVPDHGSSSSAAAAIAADSKRDDSVLRSVSFKYRSRKSFRELGQRDMKELCRLLFVRKDASTLLKTMRKKVEDPNTRGHPLYNQLCNIIGSSDGDFNKQSPFMKENPYIANGEFTTYLDDAVDDFMKALASAKERNGRRPKKLRFRSKATLLQQSFQVQKVRMTDGDCSRHGENHYVIPGIGNVWSYKPLPPVSELTGAIRIIRTVLGKVYVSISTVTKMEQQFTLHKQKSSDVKTEDDFRICSVDPGSRTMATLMSLSTQSVNFIEIGTGKDAERLLELAKTLDRLISARFRKENSQAPSTSPSTFALNARQRRSLRRRCFRIRERIKNLRADMHNRLAKYMVRNHNIILLPRFDTKQMIHKDAHRKLSSKGCRQLMTWSHATLRNLIKDKARHIKDLIIIEASEAWTTKTCSQCGEINDIGRSKQYLCAECGHQEDRDINSTKVILARFIIDILPSCVGGEGGLYEKLCAHISQHTNVVGR
jgi:transposase